VHLDQGDGRVKL